MTTRALDEPELHRFLRRRRRREGVELPPFGPGLRESLDLAAGLLPVASGALYLDEASLRERGDTSMTCVAAFGPLVAVGSRAQNDDGVARRAYATGKTVRERQVVALPIRLERAVCGVLVLGARRGRRFGPRDLEVAELLAGYLARSILNAVDLLKQSDWALRDDLTGTLNVRALEPGLEQAIVDADARHEDVAVLFVDVDGLKALNDSRGHRAGSEALRRVGGALLASQHARGEVYRFGGDEFVVVVPGIGAAAALERADALRATVARHTGGRFDGAELPPITVSVGAATLRTSVPPDEDAASTRAARLLAAADDALYRAKDSGRNAVVLASARPAPG